MPRKQQNTKESIVAAAIKLIEENGHSSFSVRNVANFMNISTQPLYSYFNDSNSLYEAVLDEIGKQIVAHTQIEYTEFTFRNMGFGFTLFAKHHPNLFDAFFSRNKVNEPFQKEFLMKLKYALDQDQRFDTISTKGKSKLIEKMWIFCFGYSKLLTEGFIEDDSDEVIKATIMETGTSIIFSTMKKEQ